MSGDQPPRGSHSTRRRALLAAIGTATLGGLAGCSGGGGGDGTATTDAGVPGLRLALRADVGVTTDDEGRVETWADQSGNGYDVSTDTPESRPTVTEDAVNGQPTLAFDGEDDHLMREDTLGIANDSPRTFVVCGLARTTPRSPYLMQGKPASSNQHYGLEANTFETAGERFGAYVPGRSLDSNRQTDTNHHVHTLRTGAFSNVGAIGKTTTHYIDGAETPLRRVTNALNSGTPSKKQRPSGRSQYRAPLR